jgi:uncharacterized repeat protein (TIGR03803 family)
MRENSLGRCGWKRCLAAFLLCSAAATAATAQSFAALHDFSGADGSEPNSPLVEGFDGKLYGTTTAGGSTGGGTFFKIGVYAAFTSLYNFCDISPCPAGLQPEPLVLGQYGDFNGATNVGGVNGGGTVFRFTPTGGLTTLYSFCLENDCAGGAQPFVSFQTADGSIYGASREGGKGAGMVFKVSSGGLLNVLYRFNSLPDFADGLEPTSLVQGTDGTLYGTTMMGGTSGGFGEGTVFRLAPDGILTVLHSFCSPFVLPCQDGRYPSHLTQGADGNLYGTTNGVLVSTTEGTSIVFKITPEGVLTTLYNFCPAAVCAGGIDPSVSPTGLVQGTDGNLYGTTCGYAAAGYYGLIFKLTLDGTETILHSFNGKDGSCPQGLMQATNGKFYGTTQSGGTEGDGTVFRLDVGLGPFVKTVLTSGCVGARVVILGTDLTGTTGVSFNGTAATFKIASATSIVTSVPEGATSGSVTVTTPTGTLTSNIAFTVLP